MNFSMAPDLKLPLFLNFKSNILKIKKSNQSGLENFFSTQSKRQRFLEQLANQRIKNIPGQFHGIDLSYVDLSNIDLSDIDLTGANLTSANLSGSKLIRTNLTGAKLSRTIFHNANLTNVILTNVVIDRLTQLAIQQAFNQQWYEAAQKSIAGFNQEWEKLKTVDGFNAFDTVLKRLNESSLQSGVTIGEIVEVIEAVVQSPDIRRLIFMTAQGVDVSCYAHLLTVFNTAQGLARFDKLRRTNAAQQEILALAQGMVRQNLLDETTLPIMRQQWSEGRRVCNEEGTGPNIDGALNVQLALRHQLATQLNLPCPIKNPMEFTDSAGLNHSDKEFAVDFIDQYMSDDELIVEALISLPVWQLYLEYVLGKKIIETDLDEPLQIAMDEMLRHETEKMMCVAI
jgi:hypothetical protein